MVYSTNDIIQQKGAGTPYATFKVSRFHIWFRIGFKIATKQPKNLLQN